MPLQGHMKLISVDDHIIEHPRTWADRLPARYRASGPNVLRTTGASTDGYGLPVLADRDVWIYQGKIYPQVGLNAIVGKNAEDYTLDPYRFDDMRVGCFDPSARMADLDEDGIWGMLGFPSLPGFAGTFFLREGDDKDLGLLCVKAWNDFVIDEWVAAAPDRVIPLMILPWWDVPAAEAEIDRMVARGVRAISFVENPTPLGLPSWHTDHWDGVFARAEEAGLPLCMHFGTSGGTPKASAGAPFATGVALANTNSIFTCADLLFSPVFHKFPNLQVALSEGGIGWVPWLLERMDYVWERHRFYPDSATQSTPWDARPSDLFRRHITGCFIDDVHGLENRDKVGVDNITWECDYPHADCQWPNARKRAAEVLADVPDADAHKIAELNARRLFNFN
jgi:predicted TIM-barrel fold metal-dependent hydrolase